VTRPDESGLTEYQLSRIQAVVGGLIFPTAEAMQLFTSLDKTLASKTTWELQEDKQWLEIQSLVRDKVGALLFGQDLLFTSPEPLHFFARLLAQIYRHTYMKAALRRINSAVQARDSAKDGQSRVGTTGGCEGTAWLQLREENRRNHEASTSQAESEPNPRLYPSLYALLGDCLTLVAGDKGLRHHRCYLQVAQAVERPACNVQGVVRAPSQVKIV
jgi:hypothetical protein